MSSCSTRYISSSTVGAISVALSELKEQLGKEVRLSISSMQEVEVHALPKNSSEWELVLKGTDLKELESFVGKKKAGLPSSSIIPLCSSFLQKSSVSTDSLSSSSVPSAAEPIPAEKKGGGGCSNFVSPLTNVIFDWTTAQRDLRVEASERIQKRFPRLVIHTLHSTATDLQGQKSHTISVELRPIASSTADESSVSLSDSEMDAVKRFHGEAVGLGFRGTLRRALEMAFLELGETFSSSGQDELEESMEGEKTGNSAASNTSVLSLYASIIHRCCTSASGGVAEVFWENGERTVCVVRQGGVKSISSGNHSKSPLVALLTALEAAAAALDGTACEEVKRKVAHSNLYVLLPERAVNVKHVLEKILQFYLGIPSPSALSVEVSCQDGLFTAEVKVLIPLAGMKLASTDCSIILSCASGRSKKDAKELALVKSIEKHFPDIFEEQIAFHPEIQRMVCTGKASETGEIGPHISRGLLCQLEWACKKEGVTFSINSTRVSIKSEKSSSPLEVTEACTDDTSSSTGVKMVTAWRTTAALHPLSDVKKLTPIFSCMVSDSRKGRSVQKAIASMIAQKFGKWCQEAVEYAVSQRLISKEGIPVTSEKVVNPLVEATILSPDVCDFQTDPLMRELTWTPHQYVKGNEPSASLTLMGLYRQWGNTFAKKKYNYSSFARMHERIVLGDEDWEPAVVTLTVTLESEDGNVLEQLDYATCSHLQPLRALLLCYEKLIKDYGESPRVDENQETASDDAWDTKQLSDPALKLLQQRREDFLHRLPASLPGAFPLSTVAQLVMNVYGCAVVMHTVSESGGAVTVRFFSVSGDAVEEEGVSSVSTFTDSSSSPLEDDSLLLGKGEGIDMQYAVLACCQEVWRSHFKVFKSAFEEGNPPALTSCVLSIESCSKANELLQTVVEEIKLSLPCGTSCQKDLILHFSSPMAKPPLTLRFGVVAGEEKKKVELEHASGVDIVKLFQEICDSVRRETHFLFSPPKRILEPNLSHYHRLTILLSQHLGFPVDCEVRRWEGMWCCRISLILKNWHDKNSIDEKQASSSLELAARPGLAPYSLSNRNIMWCLCTCSASKKNDAVEAASIFLIRRYFPNIFTDLSPSNAIVTLSESNVTLGFYCFTA